jgi:CDP-diacylglycerol--glycerol-3-phosphate 3-phosphatidyltransferase
MDSEGTTVLTAADAQFLAAFEAGQIANRDFHHGDHLRLAWIQIRRLGTERASDVVAGAIRRFAARHGHRDRYHETMTRFWVRVVAVGINRHPALAFEELLAAEPHLLDKNLPYRHWSRDRMGSDEARRQWVEPDVRLMPA